jgi:hypothetical protein
MDETLDKAAPAGAAGHIRYLTEHPDDARALEQYIATVDKMPRVGKGTIKLSSGSLSIKKSPAKAFAECLEALRHEPDFLDSLHKLGRVALEGRWFETAVVAFFFILHYEEKLDGQAVSSIKSELLGAVLPLSEHHLAHDKFDEAREVLEKIHAVFPSSDLQKRLMEVEVRRKDVNIDHVRQRLGASAGGTLMQELKALEHERSQFVAQSCSELLKSRPLDMELHIRLGEALYCLAKEQNDTNLLKTAMSHCQFRRGPIQNQYLWQSNILMGRCLIALGMPKLGELLLSQFLADLSYTEESKAAFLEGHRQLGMVREINHNLGGALQAYLKVIEKAIGFADVLDRAYAIEHELGKNNG